jgi:hypothetical protein
MASLLVCFVVSIVFRQDTIPNAAAIGNASSPQQQRRR